MNNSTGIETGSNETFIIDNGSFLGETIVIQDTVSSWAIEDSYMITPTVSSSPTTTVKLSKSGQSDDEILWIVVLSIVGFSGLLCLFSIFLNKYKHKCNC